MNARAWISILVVALAAAGAGWWARPHWTQSMGEHDALSSSEGGSCPGGAKPLYWKAPMDPSYIRSEPGKSPMGMDLVPVCPSAETAPASGGVRIDPGVVQNMGVRTASAERRDLARRVRAVGRVGYDERLVDHVHTKFQGWVEKLHVEYVGQTVQRGQPLLEIYSPELVSTQEELLLAARYRDVTGKSSFDDVSQGGEALLRATRRRLELFDVPDRDIDALLRTGKVRKTLTLYAPTEGVVTHMMVREGMEVAASDNLYTIADLSRVWVYADVYEYELAWVAEGQKATVELSYLPGTSFEGVVTYVYPFLDPKTRTARVRVELPNPDLALKPDMYANVRIETRVHPDVLAVPEEAVIRSGARNLVVVALGEGRFEPRPVTLGIDSGDGWLEVREGLAAGERIVTSGQFLIDSESRLQEAVQKLLASQAPPAPEHADPAMPEPGKPSMSGHEGHAMPESEGHSMSEHEGHVMPEHEGHSMSGHEGHGRE